jgi:WD40 repeat protein
MTARPTTALAVASSILLASAVATAQPPGKTPALTSFERDVQPVLRKHCVKCHNAERPRGELDLTSFAGLQAGGASGKAAVAGGPDESPLYTLAAHLEDPHMPPNAAKIPQRDVDVLRAWIERGMVEKAGDTPAAAKNPEPSTPAAGKPTIPGGLIPPVVAPRASAVTALAASPSAPIVAASGHKQVILYDLAARKILGALAFPEGDVLDLRFSRDGRTLLVAGGVGAESGRVVLFDAANWLRVASVGEEVDATLAADLAPDGSRVVVGGPTRLVKVLAVPGGSALQTFRKPTDWVTAASFSPDGLLTAAGDRFGGLYLWETRSGQEFQTLRGPTKAISAMAWLPDRDGLVAACEDGLIRVWDLHAGKVASSWEAHAGGVLGIDVDRSGRIASAGRDRRVKVWRPNGRLDFDLGPAADQASRVAWSADSRLVSGDCSGEIRLWNPSNSTSAPLPLPVAPRHPAPLLVAPAMSPARPHLVARAAVATPGPTARRAATTAPAADDLEAALAAAREAAASNERTLASLARLARARSNPAGPKPSTAPALEAARSALGSLQAALAADPGNVALSRAIDETTKAVESLERPGDRTRPISAAPTGGSR